MNRTTIDLGGRKLTVYIARKPADWRIGLQGRNIAGIDGMLFAFPNDVDLAFDVKSLRYPILVAWFASDGAFLDLNLLHKGARSGRPPRPYRYALELIGNHATSSGAFDLVQPLAAGLGSLL